MKKDKEVKKENEKTTEKENLGKYLLLGILVAAIIFIVSSLSNREKTNPADLNSPDKKNHVWSQESDSEFVKICYDKYRSQVKDDLQKQENAKTYCRCMLEKMKTKYPFFKFMFKTMKQKGHPESMNIIRNMVKTPYLFLKPPNFSTFFIKKKKRAKKERINK